MQFEITPTIMIIFGVVFGAVIGLIPLILGFVKKSSTFGTIGFGSSIIGGAILGIYLSIPISAIFSWLILRKPKADESAGPENSPNTEAVDSEIS